MGAVACVGVVCDPGLSGDEDEPIADTGEDPPPNEFVVALRQKRAEIANRRGHDAREEYLPCPETVGETAAERDHDHAGKHEQCNRKAEQQLVGDDRIGRTELGDEQRQKRTRQLLGEHEQKQRDSDLHGVARPQLRAPGEAVAIIDGLAGSLDPVHDVLVDLGVLDFAHIELEVFVALPQVSQSPVECGHQVADLVAGLHREMVAEHAARTIGQHRLDALQRCGDPYTHEKHQEFQGHKQRDHDDGDGLVQQLGQPATHVFPADADVQHRGDPAVRLDRERAVDESGHLGPGARLAAGAGQIGQHALESLRWEAPRELHLRGWIQHEQVFDVRVGGENLVEEGFDPHQLVGRNTEIVHHEFDLVGDGPPDYPCLLTELRLQGLLETGDGEPRHHDLTEEQHDDGEQHQPAENSASLGDPSFLRISVDGRKGFPR